jgi:3-isopropylmalate dehydratase small subunit
VIAKSFARIFYRNSFNMGLPIFESSDLADNTAEGDEIEVDATSGEIVNLTRNKKFKANPIPPFMQELIASGGLMNYAQKKQMKKD